MSETPSAESIADEMLAHGRITTTDRDAVVEFGQFLREAGPAPKLDGGENLNDRERWSLAFIAKWQKMIGISDEQFDAIVDARAETGDDEAIEWVARRG